MNNPTMLYRCPGPESFEGVACETTVVDEPDVEGMLAEGWRRDWVQAKEAHDEAQAQLAANEAEQARIAAELAGGQDADADAADTTPNAQGLQAVHKGRGKWSVVNADGQEVQTGLTKEQALAAVA